MHDSTHHHCMTGPSSRAAILLDADCAVIVVPDVTTKARLTHALRAAAASAVSTKRGSGGGGDDGAGAGGRGHRRDPAPWHCPVVVTADVLMALPTAANPPDVPDVPDVPNDPDRDFGAGYLQIDVAFFSLSFLNAFSRLVHIMALILNGFPAIPVFGA